ncbi:MAG: DUF2905 domain-containing protein [Alphaproteobacteria bacterium]|nr:DUF2905 domain-containing protein [Alphaproteobacteria bacterium]
MSGRTLLIVFGAVLILAGLLWPWLQRIGLGRLPGDIVVERESFRLYIPIGTSILVSAVVTLILWLIRR